MMGSERVVGAISDGDAAEASGIIAQSVVELFSLLKVREDARSKADDTGACDTEAWNVRVRYFEVRLSAVGLT